MKHYGDITQISGYDVEPVWIVTGGSPCQDLSVAGKRAGLDGQRSGLFMEQIRIIKEMRERDRNAGRTNEFIRPRYMVWENVPGAFSSNKGEDFRVVLEETAKVADENATIPRPDKKWTTSGAIMGNGWSIAWRVHDAQFWGVAQRRRRIALVADFGGNTAPEILFERESVSGNIEQSGKEGQGTAADIETSIDRTNTSGCKVISYGFDPTASRDVGKLFLKETAKTCTVGTCPSHRNGVVCYGICSQNSNSMKSSNPNSGTYEAETSRTLDNNGGNPACNQGGIAVVQGFDGFNLEQTGDKTQTLTAQRTDTKNIPIITYSQDAYDKYAENEKSASLKAQGGTYGGERSLNNTVGALCADDYKGVGNQYVQQGKVVIQSVDD